MLVDGTARTLDCAPILREVVLYLDAAALVEPWRIYVGTDPWHLRTGDTVQTFDPPTFCRIAP